jgi:hypothetical protein
VVLLHATSLLVEPSALSFDVARLRSTQSLGPGCITGDLLRHYARGIARDRKSQERVENNPEVWQSPIISTDKLSCAAETHRTAFANAACQIGVSIYCFAIIAILCIIQSGVQTSFFMQALPGPLLTSGSHGSSGGSTDGEQMGGQKYAVGWWRQYRVLLWRSLLSYTRNPSDVAGRIFMAIGTSLVGGLVFINSVKGTSVCMAVSIFDS